MLLLGHTGITLGAATLLAGVLGRTRKVPALHYSPGGKTSWFISLGSYIDIRVLLIGSLLSDIIDKPVGQFFFRETFNNGRIFFHTLLSLVLITVAGFYLYRRRRKVWLLVLAFGTFTHLMLDQVWDTPKLLFWPFMGFTFERIDLADWVANILSALLADPKVYIPELVGTAVLLWFSLVLVARKKVYAFIRHGQVE